MLEGATNLIKQYRPHIVLEIQLQHILNEMGGKERIAKWFNFLRYDMNYAIYYIPWEQIKYAPTGSTYGK